jgi:adenylate cyclase
LTTTFTKNRKRLLKGLLIVLAVGMVCSLVSYFQLFSTLSQKSNDLLFRGQSSSYVTDTAKKIVIVGIDDASLKKFGRISSWPRALHAKLINALNENGARIIAFDILFSENSPDDAIMSEAIKQAGNVILPYAIIQESKQEDYEEAVKPLKTFEADALATGHGNMSPDEDGVIRTLPLFGDGDPSKPSLSLVTVSKYLRRTEVYDSIPNKDGLVFAGREIPLQTWGMVINYVNESHSDNFLTISYADVLSGNCPTDTFRDKIVLVGVTALGFGDIYWTPLGQPISGVEIHAQAMNTILGGQFLKPVSALFNSVLILLLAVVIGLITLTARVLWSTVITLFVGICYCLAAFYLSDHGWLLDIFRPLITLAAVSLVINLYNVTLARLEKGEITRTFGRYVSPPVASKILNTMNEGSLKLGGEECPVTVLFADARGFTGFCETLGPDVVVRTLNRYFSVIIDSILKYGGIVSKFNGDNIMAVWNAPIKCPEHALNAVKAAITAQEQISALRTGISGIAELKFGIGVNTGKALVGNMGSMDRLEYSLIGDTVNISSRLSALAPGDKVWIGAETHEYVKDLFDTIPLGPHALKGKEQLVDVYELCINETPISNQLQSILEENNKVIV